MTEKLHKYACIKGKAEEELKEKRRHNKRNERPGLKIREDCLRRCCFEIERMSWEQMCSGRGAERDGK